MAIALCRLTAKISRTAKLPLYHDVARWVHLSRRALLLHHLRYGDAEVAPCFRRHVGYRSYLENWRRASLGIYGSERGHLIAKGLVSAKETRFTRPEIKAGQDAARLRRGLGRRVRMKCRRKTRRRIILPGSARSCAALRALGQRRNCRLRGFISAISLRFLTSIFGMSGSSLRRESERRDG